VLSKQGGLAQQHFNVGEMKSLLVAVPSTDEQKKIVQILKSLESRIMKEKLYLDKIGQKKHGLMQDLLTGKVRVNVNKKDK